MIVQQVLMSLTMRCTCHLTRSSEGNQSASWRSCRGTSHHRLREFLTSSSMRRSSSSSRRQTLVCSVVKDVSNIRTETSDVRASLAALQFIISSAARFDCDETVLATELAQLGMPKGALHRRSPSRFDAKRRVQSTATPSQNPTKRTRRS